MPAQQVRRSRKRIAAIAASILAATTVIGCGRGGPERTVITGTVTYLGEPIPEGAITFVADQGATTASMSAAIAEGRYKLNALGGLPTGAYRVMITATRKLSDTEKRAKMAAGQFGPSLAPQQYLPDKYNTKSQLKLVVDLGNRSLTRDFELTD